MSGFSSAAENLEELVSAVMQRIGAGIHTDHPQLLVSFQSYFVLLCFSLCCRTF